MFSNPRGYALIINNESFVNDIYKYRSGSTIDANNLDILFEQLGFKVRDVLWQQASKNTYNIFNDDDRFHNHIFIQLVTIFRS